jgi:hypothetical protein
VATAELLAWGLATVRDAGLLTESFFDDVRDELARELRLMDAEVHWEAPLQGDRGSDESSRSSNSLPEEEAGN